MKRGQKTQQCEVARFTINVKGRHTKTHHLPWSHETVMYTNGLRFTDNIGVVVENAKQLVGTCIHSDGGGERKKRTRDSMDS